MSSELLFPSSRAATAAHISCHSHIHGLGVSIDGSFEPSVLCGLVGQETARFSLGLIAEMILSKKFSGRAILLAGPPGTGKTALALALSRTLGSQIPFCSISASEIFSREVKKTEVLVEYIRRALRLRIREFKNVYEGELVDMNLQENPNAHNPSNITISAITLTLRASNGTTTLKLSPDIYRELVREKISIGDVVYIQVDSGIVRRIGLCDTHGTSVDIELENYVSLPKGDVFHSREIVQDVTLHELDVANGQPSIASDLSSVIAAHLVPRKTEITDRLRAEVDKLVARYIEEGLGELTPGVVFIDECHLLDTECYAFLNRLVENENSPTLIFATNRAMCPIREANSELQNYDSEDSPHGIPCDFLDRLLIIPTEVLSVEKAIEVVHLRANAEKVGLSDEALQLLANLTATTSMRYALQLISPAQIICQLHGESTISRSDLELASQLFVNANVSLQKLRDN